MQRSIGVLFLLITVSFTAWGSGPEIILTNKNSYNGYAFVAGKVISKIKGPVGITVEIGGMKFSTISDPAGNWGIVFRHIAINFNVTAWNFEDDSLRVAELSDNLPIE